MKTVSLPSGLQIRLVPREQLRFKIHGRRFSIPQHLKGIASLMPTPPATFDWSKGGQIKYPLLGNGNYGDCFYAAMCHASQTWTGLNGNEYQFNEQQVINRYLQLSGGDNGLDDATIVPEFKAGIVGPNGPRKIFSIMTVNPQDDASTALAMWAFFGLMYTAALPDAWVANPQPGQTWDAGIPDQNNGHAMWLSGKNARGGYDDQTWGFGAPINLTPAGLKGSDPELLACASMDMFNSQGYAPDGVHYLAKATLWQQCGGSAWPASPFPAPNVNPPTPIPPGPGPAPLPPLPPIPIPGPSVQQQIDAMFAALIKKWQRYPYVVQAIQFVQQQVNAYLQQHPIQVNHAFGATSWQQVAKGIIDVVCVGLEQQYPQFAPMVAMVQVMIDGYLMSLPAAA